MSKKNQVCIPKARAKELGIEDAQVRSLQAVLKTPTGRSYVRAKTAFQKEFSAKNSSCSVLSTISGKHAAAVGDLLRRYGNVLKAKDKRTLEKQAQKLAAQVGRECERRAKSETKRAERASALKGRR